MKKKFCSKNFNFNSFGVRESFSYSWEQSYGRLSKISWYMLDERFGEKQLCWECAKIFHHFRNSSTKFSEFWRKIFCQGRHNWILRIRMKIFCFFEGRNWRKSYFFRRKMLCHPFRTLRETDSPYFWRHYYGRFVKNSLYVFRRRFLQINFLEGLIIFPHFRKSSKNFSEFWRQNFGRVVTTALYMYIGTFLGKLFSFRKVQCFFRGLRNLSCQSVACRRKLFAIVVKIAGSVAKESILMKTNSDQKKVTAFFGLWETFSHFWRQRYSSLVKISLYMFRRKFCEKTGFLENLYFFSSFPEFEQKVFTVLTRNFWQGFHNCILHVHWNILRIFIILSQNFRFFWSFLESELQICGFLEKKFC